MIAHVVLFQPRGDLTADQRRQLLDALRAAAEGIPQVLRFRVGRRVRHGMAGYEQSMRDDYEFAAIVEVDTLDDLKTYLAHPAHSRLGQYFSELSSRALAYDYEVVEAADARRLTPD